MLLQLVVYRCNPVYIWDGTSGSHDTTGVYQQHSNRPLSLGLTDLVGYEKSEIKLCSRTFPVIGQPSCLSFSLTIYPASLKPEDGICPFP
jgi:hypothetical protein